MKASSNHARTAAVARTRSAGGRTFHCLAGSCCGDGAASNSGSKERAHSISLTLLCTNVLLCGGLLGFPKILGHVVHPFITAHYGWSGIIDSLEKTAYFTPIDKLVKTWFATPDLALIMLGVHFLVGVVLAFVGLRRRG